MSKKIKTLLKDIAAEISNSKNKCFDNLTEKLGDTKLNQKAYWGNLNSFTNLNLKNKSFKGTLMQI